MSQPIEVERHIAFEAVRNCRDLGGYETTDGRRVRWRRLFRSDQLHQMTDADVAKARNELGIQTVIDLRQSWRARAERADALIQPPVCYIHISLLKDETQEAVIEHVNRFSTLAESMLGWMKDLDYGKGVVQVLNQMVRPGAVPVVFHCTGGHHRTGTVAAVVLGILGVPDETIVSDYALTALARTRRSNHPPTEMMLRLRRRIKPFFFEAVPETMAQILDTVRREYGSMRGYAEAHGAAPSLFRSLEDALLE